MSSSPTTTINYSTYKLLVSNYYIMFKKRLLFEELKSNYRMLLLLYDHPVHYTHLIEHSTALFIDHSCTICYPQPIVITISIQNFWNWIETYYKGKLQL